MRSASSPSLRTGLPAPSSFLRSRLLAGLCLALAGVFFLPEDASGRTFSNRDLRVLGFTGRYKGTAKGTQTEWNGNEYVSQTISARAVQLIPERGRRVRGPDGNRFSLSFRRARGTFRRVKIRGTYTGVSYNPFWDINMVGSGSYVVTLVRRGRRVKASIVDRFRERDQINGDLYNFWTFRARNLQ